MQQPAPAGQLKLGVAQAPRRAPRDPCMQFVIIRKAHFAGTFALKLCNFCPAQPPWVGVRVWLWVGKYSTKSLSLTVPRWA